jgi:aminomethyltransferase
MALATFVRINHFGDAAAEAKACRTDCALFDFSFLECAQLKGGGAAEAIEAFTGRSLAALAVGKICYALRVAPSGALVADLTVWRTGADTYEVMSGRHDEVADLLDDAGPDVVVTDVTSHNATFALQGPGALDALNRLGDARSIKALGYFSFGLVKLKGISCRIGRLGYTGEAGFEIIISRGKARDLWHALSEHARPAGFIAADMLRIEAGLVLFSNDFRIPVSPEEAGLGKFRRPLARPAPKLALISFRADADGLQLPWEPTQDLRAPIVPGEIAVTSACRSIAADGILGLGYVLADTKPDTSLHDPSSSFYNIRRTSLPFYDCAKRRPRQPWR